VSGSWRFHYEYTREAGGLGDLLAASRGEGQAGGERVGSLIGDTRIASGEHVVVRQADRDVAIRTREVDPAAVSGRDVTEGVAQRRGDGGYRSRDRGGRQAREDHGLGRCRVDEDAGLRSGDAARDGIRGGDRLAPAENSQYGIGVLLDRLTRTGAKHDFARRIEIPAVTGGAARIRLGYQEFLVLIAVLDVNDVD